MVLRVRSGPAEIFEHGTVTACWGNSIFLEVEFEETKIAVELVFDDQVEGEPRVETEYTEEGLRLRCLRFGDSLGKGSAQPVLLGELEASLIFLHFRVFRYGNTEDKTVHYTFYRVSKDAVGWNPVVENETSG